LRRLFEAHLGASPLAVARTQRVHFARKLLDETNLAMTEVAHAAGFASLRRFNDAVRKSFHASPTDLRQRARARAGKSVPSSASLRLRLPFREPLAYGELLGFLGARAIPGVERVEGGAYARTVDLGGERWTLEVTRGRDAGLLLLEARVAAGVDLYAVVARLRRLFDLDADPRVIDEQLARDTRLRRMVRARPGLRVPGAWDGFELLVRAVLGQQVTVAGATTLAGRLVTRFGEPLPKAMARDGLTHVFPTPRALSDAPVEHIGVPRARAEAIRAIAHAVAIDATLLDDPSTATSLPGIGAWTASYVAMRGARDPDALPASDLGLRRALASRDGVLPSARAVETLSEIWRPWRAYAAMHLWTKKGRPR
jgi:AraC family transcriptional regulator of adaptative response / DNA-3-methyladenine glycosylase II